MFDTRKQQQTNYNAMCTWTRGHLQTIMRPLSNANYLQQTYTTQYKKKKIQNEWDNEWWKIENKLHQKYNECLVKGPLFFPRRGFVLATLELPIRTQCIDSTDRHADCNQTLTVRYII